MPERVSATLGGARPNLDELCKTIYSLLRVETDTAPLGVFVGYTIVWGDRPLNPRTLDEEVEKVTEEIRSRYSPESLREDPIVRAYRDFYWRIGIDPTKTRPSSEALVRRILRGRGLPRIDPIVDAGNIASAQTMVPIGLYDVDRVVFPVTLRLSHGNELFKPIGGGEERLKPRIPILVDSEGKVIHLYPHRDSIETAIRGETVRVFALAAGVPGVPRSLVRKALEKYVELMKRLGWSWCGQIVFQP